MQRKPTWCDNTYPQTLWKKWDLPTPGFCDVLGIYSYFIQPTVICLFKPNYGKIETTCEIYSKLCINNTSEQR